MPVHHLNLAFLFTTVICSLFLSSFLFLFFTQFYIFIISIMGWTCQTTAGFQDTDFEKAIKMVLTCILSVIFHLSGVKL